MSSHDIWLRKYHELWEKLEDNTKSSFCTALWKWLVIIMIHVPDSNGYKSVMVLTFGGAIQAWCEAKEFDNVIHPIIKCVVFLEDLLEEMVAKNSKDPFGTIRVARKALSKIR